jgi:asparagine synthase (glutamine-hydrolysing)
MCGIAGILDPSSPIDRSELLRMTSALSHRGPDGLHTEIFDSVGLGHTRLSILDLSMAGQCPMEVHGLTGTKYHITFNGEIYNFLELRRELEAKGYAFKSNTDTEVIVAAYDLWGRGCTVRFNGMWAFAIYDHSKRELYLSRDRFGVKPLYYSSSKRFAFASELKAFVALRDYSPKLNDRIVPGLLRRFRYDGVTDETALDGVRSLPGGHNLFVTSDGTVRIERWWDTAGHIEPTNETFSDQVEHFRQLFLDAVRIRMRSDVPVGTCLSGGVDSSSVACAMAAVVQGANADLERCTKDWQRTFVATFSGTSLDERVYADQIISHIGSKPVYYDFSHEESLKHLVDCIWSLDEPTGGYAISPWLLYRSLRESGVVVSLDGHGGDELLGGYSWYLDSRASELNSVLYEDLHAKLLPTILRNYDRCSAAHGIEVRMPLLDYRVVTYAFSLPASAKIGGGYTKRILRESMKGIVPDSIRLRRQKIGFNAPMIEWFNGGLVPLIEKVTQSHFWLNNPFFDGRELAQQILSRSRAKAWVMADWNSTYQVSTAMNLAIWYHLFVDRDERAWS